MSDKRELFKIIEVAGRKWRIEKFSPLVGSFVCIKVLSKMSHIFFGIFSGKLADYSVIATGLMEEFGSMTEQEFATIQAHCLRACSVLQMVGTVEAPLPVLDAQGRFANGGLEHDTLTVLALTGHVLVFNLRPFLDVEELKGTLGTLPDTIPKTILTSTDTPSGPSV